MQHGAHRTIENENPLLQKCFQLRWTKNGRDYYIPMERVLAYEHGSPYSISDRTRDKLLDDIDMEEFTNCALKSRIILNDLEDMVPGQGYWIRMTEPATLDVYSR